MTIETKFDFKSYLKLMYTLTYRKPIMVFLTIAGLIMLLGSILYFLGFHVLIDSFPTFQIGFGLGIIGIVPFSIYKASKKNFSSYGKLQEKIIYEFTDEKIKQIGETFTVDMDWTKIYKLLELKDWILIYQNRQMAYSIPKESFGENLQEFRDLVRSKGVKAKLKNK